LKYPSISERALETLGPELLAGADPSIVNRDVRMLGSSDQDLNLDLTEVIALSRALEEDLAKFENARLPRDSFEGQIAGRVHSVISKIDIQILDDKGFWRYLCLRYFWWLASWREDAFAEGVLGEYRKYVDAHSSTECVLTRTYLRGQIALEASGEDKNYDHASAVEMATDFWRSHISRVNNWKYPSLVRAFVEMQRDARLATTPLRAFARALNRRRSNFWLRELSHAEAASVIDDLRPDDHS
jgi:hypothetical protein